MRILIHIGEIEALRKKADITQTELAKSVGCKQAYISHIEKGKANPSFKMLDDTTDVFANLGVMPREIDGKLLDELNHIGKLAGGVNEK